VSLYCIQVREPGEKWVTVDHAESQANAEAQAVALANETMPGMDIDGRLHVASRWAHVCVRHGRRTIFNPRAAHAPESTSAA
jgi:hypothetical protein